MVKRWAGVHATRGALLLDLDPEHAGPKTAAPDEATTYRQLASLLDDADPRLVPVQTLATDLLWRSEDVAARAIIEEVELNGRLALLSDRPSFLADRSLQLATVARAAVHSGNAQMVPHLVDHLLHPATQASDLTEVARALAELGGAQATEGLADFVRRYHADPDVVYESRALHVAVDHLAGVGAPDDQPHDRGAADTLQAALRDPFTEPDLRAYIAARLVDPVPAAPAVAIKTAAPPTPSPRDDGRIPMLPEVHPPGL